MWPLLLGMAQAATVVVDASGSGDVTTLEDALDLLEDGDTLEIRAGIYYESDLRFDGIRSLSVVGAGWDVTIIDGSAGVSSFGLTIGDDATVQGIAFENFTDDEAVWTSPEGGAEVTFTECAFIDNSISISAYADGTVSVYDSIFVGNNAGISGYTDLPVLHVENSLFQDNKYGIGLAGWQYTWGGTSTIVHNTFAGNQVAVSGGDMCYSTATWYVANNVFADGDWGYSFDDGHNIEMANNLFGTDLTYTGTVDSSSTLNSHDNVTGDPDFADYSDDGDWTNDDFGLGFASDAIDIGASGYGTTTEDLAGTPRPLDGDLDGTAEPDAGAYEYVPDDDDEDGYADEDAGGDDCDDEDPDVHPGADDPCGDGLDADCDGDDECPDTGEADTGDTAGPDDTGQPSDDTASPPDDTGAGETSEPTETGETASPDTAPGDDEDPGEGGGDGDCGCGSGTAAAFFPLFALATVRRRRTG